MSVYRQITVADRQSVVDIALQEYGCYEGLFTLLQDNSDRLKAIDEVPPPGMKLNIRLNLPRLTADNKAIAGEYAVLQDNIVGGATGVNHIHDAVSNYVTTDYVVTAYTSPPMHINNLVLAAGLSNLKSLLSVGNNGSE